MILCFGSKLPKHRKRRGGEEAKRGTARGRFGAEASKQEKAHHLTSTLAGTGSAEQRG